MAVRVQILRGEASPNKTLPPVVHHLGLYDCNYSLPCNATSPGSLTGSTSHCFGKRQGNSCSFSVTGTCTPNAGTSWQSSPPSTAGTCSFSGTTYTESCTAGSASRCAQAHVIATLVTDPCHHFRSFTEQLFVTGTEKRPCVKLVTVVVQPCTHNTCNPHNCHGCHDWEYRATTTTCSRTFSGSCGSPSGGCSPLGAGGGNTSLEQCSQ